MTTDASFGFTSTCPLTLVARRRPHGGRSLNDRPAARIRGGNDAPRGEKTTCVVTRTSRSLEEQSQNPSTAENHDA
jgi:hypothetical protein